ncbi:hypothetical protein BHE74_00026799 [Ensete ventricosum]|nr:hypothetical protein GW17_00019144 [Ensete ventricosum]RWW65859.1 hypothetical protein BHE74_00026799 [Ensete ventricosum]
MRTTRYQTVPPKIDRRWPIEGESTVGDRLREIEDWRKREEEEEEKKRRNRTSTIVARALLPPTGRSRAVAAHGPPARCRRPHPRAIFLPCPSQFDGRSALQDGGPHKSSKRVKIWNAHNECLMIRASDRNGVCMGLWPKSLDY